MGRPAKNGVYDFRIRAQKCNSTCKKYEYCTIRLDPLGKCAKRDKKEYYVKYVYVKQVDGTTKRKAVYGKTPADLTEKVARYVEKKPDEKKPDECKTLGQWCEIWIKDYVKARRLKPSTCKFYQSLIRYLTAELRNKKLSALKPLDFERHFNDLREHGGKNGKGLSEKTLKSYRIMLISCLERALDNDIIGVNVVKKTIAPKLDQQKKNYMTNEDMLRLISIADSGEYYEDLEKVKQDILKIQNKTHKTTKDVNKEKRDQGILFLIKQWSAVIHLVLETGIRRGEIFGMTWDCVDFLNNTISIIHNLQFGKLESPKTNNSIRTICVDVDTMQILNTWKEYQSRYAEEVGDLYNNEMDLVFCNSFGRPVDYDNFRCRYFRKMVVKAGLPKTITFHSCRHSHATALLANGTDPKTISERLGHADGGVGFTLKTYTHVLSKMDRDAADMMGRILTRKKKEDSE